MPGPALKDVAPGALEHYFGTRDVRDVKGSYALAVTAGLGRGAQPDDAAVTKAGSGTPADQMEIRNFAFSPKELTVAAGTRNN